MGREESGNARTSGPAPLGFRSSNFHFPKAAAEKFHYFLAKTFLLKDDSMSAAGLPHTWACGVFYCHAEQVWWVRFVLCGEVAVCLRGFEGLLSGGSNVTSRPCC